MLPLGSTLLQNERMASCFFTDFPLIRPWGEKSRSLAWFAQIALLPPEMCKEKTSSEIWALPSSSCALPSWTRAWATRDKDQRASKLSHFLSFLSLSLGKKRSRAEKAQIPSRFRTRRRERARYGDLPPSPLGAPGRGERQSPAASAGAQEPWRVVPARRRSSVTQPGSRLRHRVPHAAVGPPGGLPARGPLGLWGRCLPPRGAASPPPAACPPARAAGGKRPHCPRPSGKAERKGGAAHHHAPLHGSAADLEAPDDPPQRPAPTGSAALTADHRGGGARAPPRMRAPRKSAGAAWQRVEDDGREAGWRPSLVRAPLFPASPVILKPGGACGGGCRAPEGEAWGDGGATWPLR